jgi:transposase
MQGMKLERIIDAERPLSPTKQHVVLSPAERQHLTEVVATGTHPARTLTHARILLKADGGPAGPGWTDQQIAAALDVSVATIERVRSAYRREGLAAALKRRPPRTTRPRKLDGRQEAHLVTVACSTPPPGHARWTLRLLTERVVELEGTLVSDETVRRLLKKTNSSRG